MIGDVKAAAVPKCYSHLKQYEYDDWLAAESVSSMGGVKKTNYEYVVISDRQTQGICLLLLRVGCCWKETHGMALKTPL
ncbi:hypothetical protein C5167_010465 [Papaver somniferum]|uniref:Uncharacterized protein n=1 Tax=Papaver somniferum TaxID=3469 RepID=A0A4Y7K3D6_PAPSO|nr:hypothetical protein C5167_010465 [Papaver somniferum]